MTLWWLAQKDQSESCLSGWDKRIAVKDLETFDSVRGLKYLGMVHYTIPGGYLETTPSGSIEGMASMMGVTHAKTPTTPGIRTKATDGGRRETSGRGKTTNVSRLCGNGTVEPQSST